MASHLPAYEFAGEVVRMFVQPAADSQGNRRRIVAVYLDPSNFKNIGDGHTIADQIGDVLKVPGDPLDDVADDCRYGIYTIITTADKPRELVIAEAMKSYAQQGDLTSANIWYQIMMSEEEEQYRPATLGRRTRRPR